MFADWIDHQDVGDGEDFDIDGNLETAFLAWAQYEAENQDDEDSQSLYMPNLSPAGDEENERQPLPPFNDKTFPQDSPAGTFRGVTVCLCELIAGSDVDWDLEFDLHFN